MIALMILLCVAVSVADVIKLSFMSVKAAAVWCLFWGVGACVAVMVISGMPRAEILTVLSVGNVAVCGFVDMAIMGAYLFSDGLIRRILGFYPGLMLAVAIVYFSLAAIRALPGIGFGIIGIGVGLIVSLSLAASSDVARRLGTDGSILYQLLILTSTICVIISGMV